MDIRKAIDCALFFLLAQLGIACGCMIWHYMSATKAEPEKWATVNGVRFHLFHLEEHAYLCAVREQGISIIHAASCPCRKNNHKED